MTWLALVQSILTIDILDDIILIIVLGLVVLQREDGLQQHLHDVTERARHLLGDERPAQRLQVHAVVEGVAQLQRLGELPEELQDGHKVTEILVRKAGNLHGDGLRKSLELKCDK